MQYFERSRGEQASNLVCILLVSTRTPKSQILNESREVGCVPCMYTSGKHLRRISVFRKKSVEESGSHTFYVYFWSTLAAGGTFRALIVRRGGSGGGVEGTLSLPLTSLWDVPSLSCRVSDRRSHTVYCWSALVAGRSFSVYISCSLPARQVRVTSPPTRNILKGIEGLVRLLLVSESRVSSRFSYVYCWSAPALISLLPSLGSGVSNLVCILLVRARGKIKLFPPRQIGSGH